MENLRFIFQKKFVSKLVIFLLIIDSFMFTDAWFNQSYAAPVINEMNINTTDNEVSVSGTGDGNGVPLADKPFRYSIGSSQSEWVRDSSNITINETLTSGALSSTQVINNALTLGPDTASGGSIETTTGGGLEGYAYGKVITIDHTKVDSELTNFHATVYLNSTNFDFSKCKPDGSDIRFTDKNMNPLKFERVEHGRANQAPVLPTQSGSSTVTPNANVIYSGFYLNRGAFSPNNAFDNNDSTYWSGAIVSASHTGEFIGYNFNTPKVITRMIYGNRADSPSIAQISDFKIQGSNDLINWADVYTGNMNPIADAFTRTIDFPNTTGYKAWRLYVLSSNVNTDCVYASKLEFYENNFAKYNVLIPKVSSQADTEFCMWYGNSNAYNGSIEAWQDQTGKQLTYNGNVKLVPNVAKFGKAAYFDGVNDYIVIPSHADLGIGTGDFLFRFTIQPTSYSTSTRIIVDMRTASDSVSPVIYLNHSTKKLVYNIANLDKIISSTSIELGKNYDIEVSRTAGITRLFINGIQEGGDYTDTNNYTQSAMYIGAYPLDTTTYCYYGYIDEFLFKKGTGGHTSNFIPTQTPFVADSYTKLLLHFDSAPFTDECGKTVTTYGDVKPIKTAYTDSARGAYFDGSGDYFSLPNNIADFNFLHQVGTTGKWTAEFKYKANNFSNWHTLFDTCRGDSANSGILLYIGTDRSINFGMERSVGGTMVASLTAPAGSFPNDISTDHTVEVDYDQSLSSNNCKIYVDGSLVAQGTKTAYAPSTANCGAPRFGSYDGLAANNCNGYMVGARLSNGICRGGANASNYAVDQYTVFCTNFDTIYDQNYAMVQHMGDSLVDATGNGNNGTAAGTSVVNDASYGKVRKFVRASSEKITIPEIVFPANANFTFALFEKLDIIAATGSMPFGYSSTTYKTYMSYNVDGAGYLTDVNETNITTNIAGVYDGVNWGAVQVKYENGSAKMLKNGTTLVSNPVSHAGMRINSIGQAYNTSYYVNGNIGALRISTVARSDAWIKAESLSLKNELLTFSMYASSGIRESEAYDISGYVTSSRIDWTQTVPTGTSITVESNVSLDGGASWIGWKPCTSGAIIADLDGSQDTSNARLKLKQTLSTSSSAITPSLSNSIITIGMSKYVHRITAEPNKEYTVRFDVKDANGSITTETRTAYTKAQTPLFTVSNATINSIDLLFGGDNPENTEYQILCDSRYVNSSGVLTSVPTWITLGDKEITVLGLNIGTMYAFTAKARNGAGEETDYASPIYTGTQGIPVPSGSAVIAATAQNNSVTVAWNEIPNSLSYELEIDGAVKNVGLNTYYVHKDLMTATQHIYRVRGRNQGGFSEWSEPCIITTTSNLPLIPANVLAKASNDTVTVYWSPAQDALTYTVEIAGTQITDVEKNSASLFGLQPETAYTYRVKSCNLIGESEWCEIGSVTTAFLPTPKISLKQKDSHAIMIGWNKVEGATAYRIALDANENFDTLSGSELDEFLTGSAVKYTHANLPTETPHVYRVCAESPEGDSAWSDAVTLETLPERPAVPTNFRGNASNNFITLIWDAVQNVIGYDIEVDGIVVENGDSTQYQYKGLDQYTEHTYRVRSVTDEIQSYWSNLLKIWTAGGVPGEPKNVFITNSRGIAALNWDETPGAQKYEVEVDGTIHSVSENTFEHRKIGLIDNSASIYKETKYRLRSINDLGTSDWSGYYVNNAIMGQIEKGKELDLGLTASNITDFSRYTLYVNYNADALTVTDLCAYSVEKELGPGMVEGHDIEIVSCMPGHIVFKVNKIVDEGYLWTGIINNIKFTGKATGGTTLTYTAQCSQD